MSSGRFKFYEYLNSGLGLEQQNNYSYAGNAIEEAAVWPRAAILPFAFRFISILEL